MKAWLVTWEWVGDHAAVDIPFIAILSGRLGAERVQEFIERHHIATVASLREQLDYARYNKPTSVPYPARIDRHRITCGDNPFIYGRLVEAVKVVGDDKLTWMENGRHGHLVQPRRTAAV